MTVFADSSALVKLYADEDGADVVRQERVYVVSAVARVEVPAALWRKSRTGEMSVEDASILVRAFVADWYEPASPFVAVRLSSGILDRAASAAGAHGLRAYDAVQLSCALAARDAHAELDGFLCFDLELREAAGREGFRLVV